MCSYAELEWGTSMEDAVGPRVKEWTEKGGEGSWSHVRMLIDYEKLDAVRTVWL